MFDELKNLDFDTYSGSELLALIRQMLPTVIAFIQASQKLLSEDKSTQNLCKHCDKFDICKEPCELAEAQMPNTLSGSSFLSKTYGNLLDKISDTNLANSTDDDGIPQRLDHSSLKSIDRIRSDEIFMLYKNCHPIFTAKEWRAVTLRVEEGLTYKAIGLKLGIETSTASDTFQRAKRRMEQHYQKK